VNGEGDLVIAERILDGPGFFGGDGRKHGRRPGQSFWRRSLSSLVIAGRNDRGVMRGKVAVDQNICWGQDRVEREAGSLAWRTDQICPTDDLAILVEQFGSSLIAFAREITSACLRRRQGAPAHAGDGGVGGSAPLSTGVSLILEACRKMPLR